MHDFFATAKFTLSPGCIPLPDGESTPPMQAIMRSFDDAEIIPFSAARVFWTKTRKARSGRSRRALGRTQKSHH
ncbi:MAG TPA: hypothetical protein VFJ90_01925 [Candidatus Didemnitutus sp.]|nr:hypothetical protein [Candidatus Didemnitutus sp.]